MNEQEKKVHERHCAEYACKYGDDDNCPVVSDVLKEAAKSFCEKTDKEEGEVWSNDYELLPEKMAEFHLEQIKKGKKTKKITVTIKEFLENGGKLKEGREIYSDDFPVGVYKEFDDKTQTHLAKNNTFKSFPISELHKVEIKTIPIYK